MAILGNLFVKLGLKNDSYNKGLKESGKKTSTFGKGVSKIGGLIAGAFAVSAIVNFGKELLMLGGIAEGVRDAFNRMADDNVLNDLKEATKGTVSELELMKRAVSAKNLGVPIENLAKLFEFATKRAQDTGESVDFLVNSIVTGIGRKSPLILDNLGISAIQLREKLKGVGFESAKVADIAKAVGEIAADSMRESGEIIDTNAVKVANLAAQWENVKLAIAENETVINGFSSVLSDLESEAEFFFSNQVSGWRKFWTVVGGVFSTDFYAKRIDELAAKNKQLWDEESTEYRNSIAGGDEVIVNKEEQIKTIGELKAETEELTKSLDLYGVNQETEIQKTLKQIAANKELIKTLTSIQHGQADIPSEIEGIGTPDLSVAFDPETGLADMTAFRERMGEQLDMFTTDFLSDEQAFVDEMNSMMEMGVEDFVSTFAEGLGRLASGDIGFQEFFNGILEAIGGFLGQMGKMLIAYGFAMEAFKKAFTNPFVAIAAGIALVAIGGAISGLASKGPAGSGGSVAYSGGGGSSSSNVTSSAQAQDNNFRFVLEGTTLVAAIDNTNRRRNTTR